LRAPAGAKKAGAKGDEKAPPVPQSETVKVSPPPVPGGTEETATADKTQVPQAVTGKETGTQPLKKVGKPAAGPQETTTLSRPQKPEEAAGEEQAAAPGKPKQTLKLKTGGKAGKTLKVSRGKGESGKTVRVPIKDGGEGTVKVPAPEGAEQPGAPGVPQAAATVAAQPGIGYTFAAVITLAALGAVAVFLVLQLLAHLQ
ncbi:MAG: hypothetical protein K9N51_13550, partial [Candidatus Pacebacteria bacterium]|nr:hypothetical protein [Candidatus Paceibacterota bacterium]